MIRSTCTRAVACLAAALAATAPALAGPPVTPLVATQWLAGTLDAEDLVVLDVRSAGAFAAARIPGSARTDYPGGWRATRAGVSQSFPDGEALGALASR